MSKLIRWALLPALLLTFSLGVTNPSGIRATADSVSPAVSHPDAYGAMGEAGAAAPRRPNAYGNSAVGLEVEEYGRGIAQVAASMPMELGLRIVGQRYTIAPGKAMLWHLHPDNTLVVMIDGSVKNHLSCTNQETWSEGKTYFQKNSQRAGAAPNMMVNEGTEPARLFALSYNVPADLPADAAPITYVDAPAGCPTAEDGLSIEDMGRGITTQAKRSDGTVPTPEVVTFEQDKGKNLVIEEFRFYPGFSTGFHVHPGSTIVVPTVGQMPDYVNCDEWDMWTPDQVSLQAGSAWQATSAVNESTEPTEIYAVLFNVPADHPAPVVPIFYPPPPGDCPTVARGGPGHNTGG